MEARGKQPERSGKKERENQKGQFMLNRRGFIKAVTPLGWIPELIKKGEISDLSTPAKISLAKDAALVAGASALIATERRKEQPFKGKVLSFTWEHAKSKDQLNEFTNRLAEEYIRLTKTKRVTKEDLVGQHKTSFYKSTDEFVKAVREVEPSFNRTKNQWGYTHYASKRVFIDLDTLEKQATTQHPSAGLALLDSLWHEWGHLDVSERTSGELINNPQKAYFHSPISNKNEPYRKYRGAAVYTDTYYGFLRFEEVLNETITVRRMVEQVGLEAVISARDYYENGIDFFPKFTSSANIPLDTLYELHATSDFEGLAKLIGGHLPGKEDPLLKGKKLFIGIHDLNRSMIEETGVFRK